MRRTPEQLRDHYLAKAKAIEDKKHLRDKIALLGLYGALKEVADRRNDRTLQAAAASISAQANAIPVQIPQ